MVPLLKNYDSAIAQWQYFSNIISQQVLDFNKLQNYIEVLNNPKSNYQSTNQSAKLEQQKPKTTPSYMKKKQQFFQNHINQQTKTFNPNKTFGGEKSKFNIFPLKPQFDQIPSNINIDNDAFNKRKQYKQNQNIPKTFTIINNMESIYKTLLDNQHKMEQFGTTSTNPYKFEEKKYF